MNATFQLTSTFQKYSPSMVSGTSISKAALGPNARDYPQNSRKKMQNWKWIKILKEFERTFECPNKYLKCYSNQSVEFYQVATFGVVLFDGCLALLKELESLTVAQRILWSAEIIPHEFQKEPLIIDLWYLRMVGGVCIIKCWIIILCQFHSKTVNKDLYLSSAWSLRCLWRKACNQLHRNPIMQHSTTNPCCPFHFQNLFEPASNVLVQVTLQSIF